MKRYAFIVNSHKAIHGSHWLMYYCTTWCLYDNANQNNYENTNYDNNKKNNSNNDHNDKNDKSKNYNNYNNDD